MKIKSHNYTDRQENGLLTSSKTIHRLMYVHIWYILTCEKLTFDNQPDLATAGE